MQLFKGEELYIIPEYQRPYSWGYDECYMLYNDLMNAFQDDMREYFVGNIVMAKYDQPRYERQIVDGQQRLTTLWILLKVLSIKCDTINPLKSSLGVEAREGGKIDLKIQSRNSKDYKELQRIFAFDDTKFMNERSLRVSTDDVLNFQKSDSLILQAALLFYDWCSYYERTKGFERLKEFANYLLDNIFLLPIELYDSNKDAAVNKALTIFETINNRGKDLDNADIFKSKLFERALFVHEQDKFTELWRDFVQQCVQINIEIDEIFRFYSHVVRGKENITSMEIKLRDFFTVNSVSPISKNGYEDVMNDLFKIIEVIRFIKNQKHEKESICGKWFQVIDAYSNNYPFTAIVVYLFVNGFNNEPDIVRFTKAVIRYAYAFGSSRSVKFGIYNIITAVANKRPYDDYLRSGAGDFNFASSGRIKEGFAMIAYYQNNPIVPNLNIDRWISGKDYDSLPDEWKTEKELEQLDSIGNYVILDVQRVCAPFKNRVSSYNNSALKEVKDLIKTGTDMSISNFKIREETKRKSIEEFFKTL